MKKAFFHLFISTASILIGLLFAHFALRLVSLSQPIAKANQTHWWENRFVIAQTESMKTLTSERLESLKLLFQKFKGDQQGAIYLNLGPENYNELLEKLPTLFLENPEIKFIVNFRNYKMDVDRKIIQVIESKLKPDIFERIIIDSSYDNVIKELRKAKSDWPLAIGRGQASRMLLLNTLGLESVPPVVGDVYILDFLTEGDEVSPRLVKELHRRNIEVFVAPDETELQWSTLIQENVDGIITRDAEKLFQWLTSNR